MLVRCLYNKQNNKCLLRDTEYSSCVELDISARPLLLSSLHKLSRSRVGTETADHTINQTINQSINQSISQSINQSINQSVKQSINQSINQSNLLIDQLTNRSYLAKYQTCCYLAKYPKEYFEILIL